MSTKSNTQFPITNGLGLSYDSIDPIIDFGLPMNHNETFLSPNLPKNQNGPVYHPGLPMNHNETFIGR